MQDAVCNQERFSCPQRRTVYNQKGEPVVIDEEKINDKDQNGNYIAKPGSIMRKKRPDGGYRYYRVTFEPIRVKDNLLNKKLDEPVITESNGKTVVTMQPTQN